MTSSENHNSIGNRDALAQSDLAGCFRCLQTFAPADVTKWIDGDDTAI